MFQLFSPIFRSVWSYKEVKIILGFSLFPLFHALMTIISPDFIAIQTIDGYKTTFIDYLALMMTVLYNIVAPSVVLTFLVAKVFRSDFEQGIYSLYKDLDRRYVFFMKMLSMIMILVLFFLCSIVTSGIAFYAKIAYLKTSSLALIGSDWQVSLVSLISYFAMFVILIDFASFISLKKGRGFIMLATIVLMLVSSILSFVSKLNYVIPLSYKNLYEFIGLPNALFTIVVLVFIYTLTFSSVGFKIYRNMEF